MGCDIHAYLEYRDGDEWCYDVSTPIQRDYVLFSLMANVRGKGFGIMFDNGPRGLPIDISPEALAFYKEMQVDAHSSSYLTLDELKEIQKVYPLYEEIDDDETNNDNWCKAYLLKHHPEHVDKINEIFTKDLKKITNPDLDSIIKRMEMYDVNGHDTRLVFWFDN